MAQLFSYKGRFVTLEQYKDLEKQDKKNENIIVEEVKKEIVKDDKLKDILK